MSFPCANTLALFKKCISETTVLTRRFLKASTLQRPPVQDDALSFLKMSWWIAFAVKVAKLASVMKRHFPTPTRDTDI